MQVFLFYFTCTAGLSSSITVIWRQIPSFIEMHARSQSQFFGQGNLGRQWQGTFLGNSCLFYNLTYRKMIAVKVVFVRFFFWGGKEQILGAALHSSRGYTYLMRISSGTYSHGGCEGHMRRTLRKPAVLTELRHDSGSNMWAPQPRWLVGWQRRVTRAWSSPRHAMRCCACDVTQPAAAAALS